MKPLKIITYPDPILRKKCSKIREETNWEEIRDLAKRMHKTMHFYEGIGLAAPQIGVSLQMFVMNTTQNEKGLTFINPEIIEIDDKEFYEMDEGCLSFPLSQGRIKRPKRIKIKFLDENKKEYIKTFSDLESSCIFHETDHLSGVLFIDKMSRLRKNMILKKMKKKGFI